MGSKKTPKSKRSAHSESATVLKEKQKKMKADPSESIADTTEEESVHDYDVAEADDDIPDIVDNDSNSGISDGDSDNDEDRKISEKSKDAETFEKDDKKTPKKKKQKYDKDTRNSEDYNEGKIKKPKVIPFMDTFYQLSNEDSPRDRSIAARDLIHHCFFSSNEECYDEGNRTINYRDAAYALTRLMNGLCTGRAASRQGFASCLASFLKVAFASDGNMGHGSTVMEKIIKEDKQKDSNEMNEKGGAELLRQKLLNVTNFLSSDVNHLGKVGGGKHHHHAGGKMKGMEERDHAFGRLFGILAVFRSGILGLEDFPSTVVEGFANDLIDLYHYKKWTREPAAHAIIEFLTSLEAKTNSNIIAKVANDVIIPKFFSPGKDINAWMRELTAEQIAVALQLQRADNESIKYKQPLDKPLVTAKSVPALAEALSATSSVVYPRCHFIWNSLWIYLTEEVSASDPKQRQLRKIKSSVDPSSIIEKIVKNVVVDLLLRKGEESGAPTHERRSLALQIICALTGSNELRIVLPPPLISKVLCSAVVERLFVNVLCASGGAGKKAKGASDSGFEHRLKPLTSAALEYLCDSCSNDVELRLAFAKALISAEPRFDMRTKTRTVSSLLMLEERKYCSEEFEAQRKILLQSYLTFLEEEIISAKHDATVFIDLMYKLAKQDLKQAPAEEARRVVRFFMSGAFFDCSTLSLSSDANGIASTKKKKKKRKDSNDDLKHIPQELSSGVRIQELMKSNDLSIIPYNVRTVMSARFFSLLSDFISIINSPKRGTNQSFYGSRGRPETVYRALSEVNGICSLLETSGAKRFLIKYDSDTADDSSDNCDQLESARNALLQVQRVADESLVKECDGAPGDGLLRATSTFATSCASLMMALCLQLNSCGDPDSTDEDNEEDDSEEEAIALFEYISDLSETISAFLEIVKDPSKFESEDDIQNPLSQVLGLFVNILTSPAGDTRGVSSGRESALKLTRDTVKLAWSGVITLITDLNAKKATPLKFVDEDVMNILIESVCGEEYLTGLDGEPDESSSMDDSEGSGVFVEASKVDMDVEDVENDNSNGREISEKVKAREDDSDVELDPSQLENLLLEDSDADLSDSGLGQLEHHAGADSALANLIKMKQEARKSFQTERERVEICNRLRCCMLLESLFSVSVVKSGWLPQEAVLGSAIPILRCQNALGKSIQAASSTPSTKSLIEKNALRERLSSLVKDKISKFRPNEESSEQEVVSKACSDIFEEMKNSLNGSQCSCCSIALITAIRCITYAEDNNEVKNIYTSAVEEWSSRKATKLHSCVFDDLIQRMPSLAAVVLVEPLAVAAKDANSAFLKCESIRLLSVIYREGASKSQEASGDSEMILSIKAHDSIEKSFSKVVSSIKDALCDSTLQLAKHNEVVLSAMKHILNYTNEYDDASIMPLMKSIQVSLKSVESSTKGHRQKLCSQLLETLSDLITDKPPVKTPKKSSKKKKTHKK